ncbi:MAG: thiol reductant ABC exporter subunit CydD [Mycolicibacterium insubricum]|uniref:thiol reductant ABC exporter subunit CydD n=1 Tax=Mycolicibacterium insubricum TaxID=444597 RepID=UPI0015D4013F|nr:thiol reductant ABC exporter subunit CydD [Mycolicibacterium insubricum]
MWRVSAAVRRFLVADAVAGVTVSVATLAASVLTAAIVAGVITDPASRTVAHWAPALAGLAGVWVLRGVAQWAQARLSQRGATAAIGELSTRVLQSVTARDPRRLGAVRDSAATVLLDGLDGLRPYFTNYLPSLVQAAILTPAALAVMFVFDSTAALIVAAMLWLIPVFMVLIGLATRDRSAAALAAMTTLRARMLDLIAGIPTLRALGRASGPERRIAELGAVHRRSALATLRIAFLSTLVLELVATLGVAVVAVSVGMRLVYGEMGLTAGLTVLLLAPDVFWPLRRVGVQFHAAQDGKTAADAAFALLAAGPAATPPGGARVSASGATIELAALCVAGRDGFAPANLSGDIAPGAVTVLTGPNGAGKSTALTVLAGLTAPDAGSVRVSGVQITELDLSQWWAQLSWLPQRPVLIPGTVLENLNLFGPLEDVDSACAAAGFDSVLAELPEGAATVLGRDGVGLSLGQRQRLGLARTLGAPVPLLLLDEPTAHLDPDTADRVLDALVARARAGATVVIVGHHRRILERADHVIEVSSDVRV